MEGKLGLNATVWIGLKKSGTDSCGLSFENVDMDCRRRGWTWPDRSNYTYPDWHDWADFEPSPGDLCASLRVNSGWHGENCIASGLMYICEKGNYFCHSTDYSVDFTHVFCCPIMASSRKYHRIAVEILPKCAEVFY